MDWKKLGKSLLFPPKFWLWLLFPLAAAGLISGMALLEETHPLRIGAYVLSFYTLTIWCARIPEFVRRARDFQADNPYARRWQENVRLRVNVTLTGNVLWNGAYGALQLALGIYHQSFWCYSLAGYYTSLALMRFFLVRHSARHLPGEKMRRELRRYRACGWTFLLTNLALSGMIGYMIFDDQATGHHEIVTIAMATYSFLSLTMAIVNVVRYRRFNSPVFSASRAISLASASVSMLTLERTMLVTFGAETMTPRVRQLFLALSGGAVSMLIVVMAVYMIAGANRKMRDLENEHGNAENL